MHHMIAGYAGKNIFFDLKVQLSILQVIDVIMQQIFSFPYCSVGTKGKMFFFFCWEKQVDYLFIFWRLISRLIIKTFMYNLIKYSRMGWSTGEGWGHCVPGKEMMNLECNLFSLMFIGKIIFLIFFYRNLFT